MLNLQSKNYQPATLRFIYRESINISFTYKPDTYYPPVTEEDRGKPIVKLDETGAVIADIFNPYARPGEESLFYQSGDILKPQHIENLKKLGYLVLYPLDIETSHIRDKIASIDQDFAHLSCKELKDHSHSMVRDSIRMLHETGRFTAYTDKVQAFVDVVMEQSHRSDLARLSALSHKCDKSFGHAVDVMLKAMLLGERLELEENEILELAHAALHHDDGKIFIRDEILKKEGPLTPKEREEMQMHIVHGQELHTNCGTQKSIIGEVGGRHHQKETTGYCTEHTHKEHLSIPTHEGYSKEEEAKIKKYARIVGMADDWSALTEDRVYRDALSLAQTKDIMNRNLESGRYHGEYFDALHEVVMEHGPLQRGSILDLSFLIEPEGMEQTIETEIQEKGLKGENIFQYKRQRRNEIIGDEIKKAGLDPIKAMSYKAVVLTENECGMKAKVKLIEPMTENDPVKLRINVTGNYKAVEKASLLSIDLTRKLSHPFKETPSTQLLPETAEVIDFQTARKNKAEALPINPKEEFTQITAMMN